MKLLSCEHLSGRLREICEGSDAGGHPIDMDNDKRLTYLRQLFPNEPNEVLINHLQNQSLGARRKGLGDIVAAGIKILTLGLVKPCGPCNKRKELLNQITLRDIIPVFNQREIAFDTKRNLIAHIWPTNNGAWKWNADQLIKRKDIFTGKRVIGVATGPNTVPLEEVTEHLKPLDAEIFTVPNNPRIREGATFQRLLESVRSEADSITFYCHSKGARHGEAFGDAGSTLADWTEAMYVSCLDNLDLIISQLQNSAMTGPFRRFGNFKTPGNHRWHYSGAFYWFRNADVFERNWQKMDLFFFAVESWPGLMFRPEEVACCFRDNCGDLYQKAYWDENVAPLFRIKP